MTTRPTTRHAVSISVRLAPYTGHLLRHRLEITAAGDDVGESDASEPASGDLLCSGWYASRRAAIQAGRRWAREHGFRVEKES
jgi:hypothetical protein